MAIKPTSGSPKYMRLDSSDEDSGKKTKSSGRSIRAIGKAIKNMVSSPDQSKSRRSSLRERTLTKSASQLSLKEAKNEAAALKKTVSDLKQATDKTEVKVILQRDIHSTEALYALSKQLPDDAFTPIKGAIFDQLRTLEAKNHVDYMLSSCKDSDGKLDTTQVARTLAQHREFISKSSANLFFTDGANYVKSRLTMVGTAPCDLLCRIHGCSPEDFRLPPSAVLDSGASPILQKAQRLGGQELQAARMEAAQMVENQLKATSPETLGNLRFQAQTSADICRKMEQMLMEHLGPGDIDDLRDEIAGRRASSCMEDINLKIKTFDQLNQRLEELAGKHNTAGTSPDQLVANLVGKKNLHADTTSLGRLIADKQRVPEHVRDEAESALGASFARQLADKLSDRIETLAQEAGITDGEKIEAAMALVQALRQTANHLGEV